MATQPASATARIQTKKQTLDDAYAPPANFLEIDVANPQTHGAGKKRYTDYEVRMRVRSCDLLLAYTPLALCLSTFVYVSWPKLLDSIKSVCFLNLHEIYGTTSMC